MNVDALLAVSRAYDDMVITAMLPAEQSRRKNWTDFLFSGCRCD